MAIQRFMLTNRIWAPTPTLTSTSAIGASPAANLQDQLRSKTWRSATGWVFHARNNRIYYYRGGSSYTALIAAATYSTGAAVATAVIAAFEAVDATPVWNCVYDSGTHKFTISADSAFDLWFMSDPVGTNTACIDLGYTQTDKTGGSSYTAEAASYQSRHAVFLDLGSNMTTSVAIVVNHNVSTDGTIKESHSTSSAFDNRGLNDVGVADVTLTGDSNIRIAYLDTERSHRWLRLRVTDVQNPVGYAEVGIWYPGPYVQAPRGFSYDWGREPQGLSEISVAIGGAHYLDEVQDRPAWLPLVWRVKSTTDRDTIVNAFASTRPGRCFFFSFDAVDNPTQTEYVFLERPVSWRNPPGMYEVTVPIVGALG